MDATPLQSLLQSGDSIARSGDARGAIAQYDEALRLEPGNVGALERKAKALATSGDFEGALRCHDELVDRGPRIASRRVARAQLLAHVRRYTEALADLDTALALDGPSVSLLKEKGRCLQRLERNADAVEDFRAAIGLDSEDAALWAALGDAYLEDGHVQDALEAFIAASRRDPSGFTEVDWIIRGDRSYASGRYADAITMYESGLKIRPSTSAWYGLAKARYMVQQYEQARVAAVRACELDPEDAEKWILQGSTLYELGDFTEALRSFDSAIRLSPDSSVGWSNKAAALDELERGVDALAAAEHAVELSPEDPELWINLSLYQYRLRQFEDTIKSLDRSLELNPTLFWAVNNKSAALQRLGRLEEALMWSDRALGLDPTEAAPWINKANVLADLGREALVFAVLEEALSSVQKPKVMLQLKAQLLSDKYHRHAESLKALEQARDLDPEDTSIASDHAESLVKVGQYDKARAVAREVMARETRPTMVCAMRFIIFLTYALSSDEANQDEANQNDAFQSFVEYYLEEFVRADRPRLIWNFDGLRAAIRNGAFSSDLRFLIETLMDVQNSQIRASDLSFFAARLEQLAASPTK